LQFFGEHAAPVGLFADGAAAALAFGGKLRGALIAVAFFAAEPLDARLPFDLFFAQAAERPLGGDDFFAMGRLGHF
jgi:hypothetical protein